MNELKYALELGIEVAVTELSNGEFEVVWNDGNSVYITDKQEVVELGLVDIKKEFLSNPKIKGALDSMPYEIIVQYSSATDNTDVLLENAIIEADEMDKSVLEVLLDYAVETLETYESELLGHINYEMKEEHPETWKTERVEIKKYIKKLKGYLK